MYIIYVHMRVCVCACTHVYKCKCEVIGKRQKHNCHYYIQAPQVGGCCHVEQIVVCALYIPKSEL